MGGGVEVVINDCYILFHVSSYLHAEWATAEKLMQLDKRVQMKIKRFFVKRNSMPFPDEVCVDAYVLTLLCVSVYLCYHCTFRCTYFYVLMSSLPIFLF